jgi:hypothetical protein
MSRLGPAATHLARRERRQIVPAFRWHLARALLDDLERMQLRRQQGLAVDGCARWHGVGDDDGRVIGITERRPGAPWRVDLVDGLHAT